MKPVKLICIPYAGGTSSSYIRWAKYLHPGIEMINVELAGRGKRFGEPLYSAFEEAVNDVFLQIKRHIEPDVDYALFGHSMGSWISYELYYKLLEEGYPLPFHLFFSGRRAPHLVKKPDGYWKLPESEMVELLLRYGGVSREFMEDPQLLELIMPMVRADFRITEEYVYQDKNIKLGCGVSVFTGRNDVDIPISDMYGWRDLSAQSCQVYEFAGNHFFIHEYAQEVVTAIHKILLKNMMVC
ncbi:thioesterase II family protein [Paenibacillus pini]|uniref:Thioesterase n=1 Tax=Paenibacillus pini JCM 16418 TaxID=1236976 RepID=W7YD16_9BACL|nr:thioesterase domain-containing protein [Paenibacillus pini]GAF06357.1 thioesterase [Paenibacillus pini JCM 16418]